MLFTACGSVGGPAPLATQPPKIVFPATTTYEFGRIEQGTKVVHVFPFENAGGLDLTIDNLRASCGCTAALTAARTVTPAHGGTIEVTYDTARDVGHTTRTVTVYTNDPTTPVTTLIVRGDIVTDVAVDPPQLYLGHLRAGQTARNELRLVAAQTANLTVSAIEASGTVLDARVQDSAGRRIRIAINKDAPIGRFAETLLVRTSSARQPLLTVPVTGIVDPPSSVTSGERKQ